ncbi:MAG: class I SAM-dependent methyltransferase [Actinomycetota bacterium]
MAEVYDQGRYLLPEAANAWRDAVRSSDDHLNGPMLDVGCGTGRFSSLLTEWFDASVIGIEPTEGMLRHALKRERNPRVRFVRGSAEHIPLREDSCGGAWLSNVHHHFNDLQRAADELRRVLKNGSPVFLRGAFPDRPCALLMLEYFPQGESFINRTPTFETTSRAFTNAAFRVEGVHVVHQLIADTLDQFLDRMKTRADSLLESLDDDDFTKGIEKLEHDVKSGGKKGPLLDPLDLVVFRSA